MNLKTQAGALLLALTLIGSEGDAQENGASGESARVVGGPRHFDRPIDFWRTGATLETAKDARPSARDPGIPRVQVRENVWSQPIRMPDGSWTIYVPPPAVLDFLENPTKDTAKVYLAWKTEQSDKLKRAFVLLAEAKGESGAQPAPLKDQNLNAPQNEAPSAFQITYFHQKACPHCASQDVILTKWLAQHPEATMDLVEGGERPELWKAHHVRGTPTLVLSEMDQNPGETLVGLSDEKRLEAAIARLRMRTAKVPAESPPERKE
jgi:glutaredoxin